jgi:hypothetical protein
MAVTTGMTPQRTVILAALLLGACDGGGSGGPVDTGVVPVDIDNGSCGDQIRFTGEFVDWDTHAAFCGINAASLEVPGGAMDTTAPNGRFDLCLANAATTRVNVTFAAANSQCTTPPAAYTIPTIIVATKAVIQSGGFFSGRAFTTARQTTFFQKVGVPFDPAKAQVFVHVDGPSRVVTLGAAHAATQSVIVGTVSTDWQASETGQDLFFPNVDVGSGSTTLGITGSSVAPATIPLVAGTITNVSAKTM